jgi:hypothetical protein
MQHCALLIQISHQLKLTHCHAAPQFNTGHHTSATRKIQAQHLPLRNQEEQGKKYPEFVVPVHQVFLILIGKLHIGVRGGAVG